MEGFLEFLTNNYVWFLTVAILLVFALIGYLIDNKSGKETKVEEKPKQMEDVGIQTIQNKSLNEVIESNVPEPSNIAEVASTPLETQGLGEEAPADNPVVPTVSETLTFEEK